MNELNQINRKMTLTMPEEFYTILEARAALEFIPPSTYVRKFLMEEILINNSKYMKEFDENENQ